MRKTLSIIAVLVVVVLVVAYVGQRWFTRPQAEPGPAALDEPVEHEGQQIVSVRGTVVPVQWTRLSFAMSGQLDEIAVTAGITVSAGQVLATLNTQELEVEILLAKSELQVQEAMLAQLQAATPQAEIDAAQASVDAALAAYEKLKAGPSAAEIAIAQANLKVAERALQQAQGAYDAVRNLPDIGARHEALQLEAATIDYQREKAAYELAVAGPDQSQLKGAQSQVAAAQARLEALHAGPQPSDVQAVEASIARAKADVAQAQLALQRAVLHAPFDGTITSVADVRSGEMVQAGTPMVTIADLTELQVKTTDLDEWGASNVYLNQTVDLTVPSLEGRTLRGRLAFLAAEPTYEAGGAVFYQGIVALEKQDPGLRWGMNVRLKLFLPSAKRAGFR